MEQIKIILDVDTGSDDAVALALVALSDEAEILGVTAVAGNVGMEQAAKNAKMTLEVCGKEISVYPGAKKPLLCERKETISVHGADGMGDHGMICPQGEIASKRAVDFILETVARYPNEVEIVALGPATNIALAMLVDPDVMKQVKRIWSMGTPGLGMGNATPVAEFNVFIDPMSYRVMLEFGVPVTVIGFDLCTDGTGLHPDQLEQMASGSKTARFLERATSVLRQFNIDTRGVDQVDLPDAVAMAVAIWEDMTVKSIPCYAACVTTEGDAYGQVIFYQNGRTYEAMPQIGSYHVDLVTAVDEVLYRQKLDTLIAN